MNRVRIRMLSGLAVLLFFTSNACSNQAESPAEVSEAKPSVVKLQAQHSAAIASAHPLSTEAGLAMLRQGGNAFDAAVAVAASLGVVEPYSAGIGGGGFWLLYLADKDEYRFVDAREIAPSAAHRDYYLNADGSVNRDRAINGPTSAAIPGQAAAFVHMAQHYGQLPLTITLAPAIDQARAGFEVEPLYQKLMGFRHSVVKRYPESRSIFTQNGQIPEVGFRIQQEDLANTLSALAEHGFEGFYAGEVGKALVDGVQSAGGDWTLEDLTNYRVVEREPVSMQIGERRLISAPPPSSGGIALAQMLSMLEAFNWQGMSEAEQLHLLSEVMKRAYKDRAEFLGDPDFYPVPVKELLSKQHIQHWIDSIDLNRATPSIDLKGPKNVQEGFHTTHFSVLDQYGNRVSATLSINLPFGSGFTVPGTGVLLNDEMDDFSASPGSPNAYGLVGAEANAIAAGKRPLSSMSPSMMESGDEVAIIGTPGGSRIITMVLLGLLEHMQNKPVEDWVSRPRVHHQYLPDLIQHEPGALAESVKSELAAKGHEFREIGRLYGNMQAILLNRKTGEVSAAADPRGIGSARTIRMD
ncbi:MAG: gamma-glutamyltransferase [Oceanobacter sp.]